MTQNLIKVFSKYGVYRQTELKVLYSPDSFATVAGLVKMFEEYVEGVQVFVFAEK